MHIKDSLGQNENMRVKTAVFFAGLLLIAGLLSGCPNTGITNKKPRGKLPQSIVSLSPDTTELVSLGRFPLLTGRTSACDYPFSVKNIKVVVQGTKPNIEAIRSVKPDIIIYDAKLYTDADLMPLKNLGAEMIGMDVNTVDQFSDFLYRLGSKMFSETAIEDHLVKLRRAYEPAKADPVATKLKVSVLIGGEGGTSYMACGSEGFLGNLLKDMGCEVVGPKSKKFEPFNLETLIAQNPDVIITSGKAEQILKDSRLQSINAVKLSLSTGNPRVASIKPEVLLRTGQRVADLIRALHGFLKQIK